MSDETLQIEKVVAGGFGLGRGGGGVLLVPGALAGETVRARALVPGKPHAELLEVLQASPQRVPAPDLPTADLAHAAYPEQLRIKRELVREALARIGGAAALADTVAETVPSPAPWGYRTAAQYLVTPQGLGYRARGSHTPQLLREDPLVVDAIHALLERLPARALLPARELALRASTLTGEVLATLIGPGEPERYRAATAALREAGAAGVSLAAPAARRFAARITPLWGAVTVTERFGEFVGPVSASGFSQVNPAAAGELYRHAGRLAQHSGLSGAALDLYGGSGLLGRHLLGTFERVRVTDASAEALARGETSPLPGLEFAQQKASAVTPAHLRGFALVAADPPRAGLGEELRAALLVGPPAGLLYVSCSPATWARDVGELLRAGYRLRHAIPFDFYPQTSHVEVLSFLDGPEPGVAASP